MEEVSIVSEGKEEWMESWTLVALDSRANFTQASEDTISSFNRHQ